VAKLPEEGKNAVLGRNPAEEGKGPFTRESFRDQVPGRRGGKPGRPTVHPEETDATVKKSKKSRTSKADHHSIPELKKQSLLKKREGEGGEPLVQGLLQAEGN